jgi:hypothetical protein
MMVSYHNLYVLDGNNNIPSEARPSLMSSIGFEGKQEMVWRQDVGEGVREGQGEKFLFMT